MPEVTNKEYSNISLNFNGASRTSEKAPTLRGTATVSDGSKTEFQVAAWGPIKAKTGGPDFYDITFTPGDPAAAARQVAQQRAGELGPVRNAVQGFEIREIGRGKIFERTDAELATNPKQPKLFGHGLVQLPSGPSYIDLSLWYRPAGREKGAFHQAFYSGNASPHDPKAAAAARAAKMAPEPG